MTRVLVFTRTTAFRHDSIPAGVRAFQELGAAHGFAVEATEDPAALEGGPGRYGAVVFLSTSGDVLTPAGREGLRAHCAAGGGFMGVHLAAGTEGGWPFYGELIGARFVSHPALQPGLVRVEDRDHPATRPLPAAWRCTDEWYEFDVSVRGRSRVLASADGTSYEGGAPGVDRPLVWCHEHGGARVFYTALGHTRESYADPGFRAHLLGGLRSVVAPAAQGPAST
ncbi:Crp/Fnr family transcriptional regulator [Streptomyces sp. AcH 505]|uniref:ThuA domain-containing protein n=1 Tax=Streptomyces sp. AcH 505 TaxID=352211 RepID=UPI0005922BD8|nr:Crp/Fnr family transcriptional regulator [Streptomyces sp. AcH 505]